MQDEQQAAIDEPEDTQKTPVAVDDTAVSLSDIPKRTIWIVEDDPAQNESIVRWLKRNKYQVESFLTAEGCIERLQTAQCEIVLTDIGLPEMDGFGLAKHLSQHHPNIICAMMTDLFRINQSDGILNAIDLGNTVLCKPLLPDDIADFLIRLHQGTLKNRQKRRNRAVSATNTAVQTKLSQKTERKNVLYTLMRKTNAEHVVLFALDPLTRKMSVAEQVGHLKPQAQALQNLIHSPVRETAEEFETIRIKNTKDRTEYTQYLTSYIRFGSCIGVPVPTETAEQLALFLFHSAPNFFIHVHEDYAESVAFRLTTLLEHENLLRQIENMQRLAMMGNLSRVMVHEINHRLGPVGFAVEDLEANSQLLDAETGYRGDLLQRAIDVNNHNIKKLSGTIQNLVQTAKLFGDLTAQTENELVKLEEIVDDVVWIIKDLARDYKVIVHWQKPESYYLTRLNPAHLQQVLLNVMTNSLQQIEEMRQEKRAFMGHLYVVIEKVEADKGMQYQILIRDNGPGIHHGIWERIFECGYTLGRQDGNGLGLFICRNLLQGLDCEIFIQSSIRHWGTTICIRLPMELS